MGSRRSPTRSLRLYSVLGRALLRMMSKELTSDTDQATQPATRRPILTASYSNGGQTNDSELHLISPLELNSQPEQPPSPPAPSRTSANPQADSSQKLPELAFNTSTFVQILLDPTTRRVIKRVDPEAWTAERMIEHEKQIYRILGNDGIRILKYYEGGKGEIVMQFADGGELNRYLSDKGEGWLATVWQRYTWFKEVLEGVQWLHSKGVAWRDVSEKKYSMKLSARVPPVFEPSHFFPVGNLFSDSSSKRLYSRNTSLCLSSRFWLFLPSFSPSP